MAVVGRERELEALRRFLEDEDHDGARVLAVAGDPGIGKTTLWRAALELAEEHSYVVLECQAAPGETQLAYTNIRDLLADAHGDVSSRLPEPLRRALAVTLLQDDPPAYPIEPGAIAVAFLATLRLLAERSRLLVAVDDAQWLDPESATALGYALRRLRDERLRILLTHRADEADRLALDRLPHDRLTHIRLSGLSVGALGRMVHEQLGRTFARPVLVRLHEVSGGNPFYALEIARVLSEHERLPVLPVPPGLRQLVAERLSALAPETVSALALVAANGRGTVSLVAAASDGDAAALLEPAVHANVIDVVGGEVRFTHPIFAAAIYELVSPRRSALHARLAGLIHDPEQRARHLALANEEPSEEIARLVAHGADLAFSRGSPAAAAELATEAVRLTHADAAVVVPRKLTEADYHFAAGNTAHAGTLLNELLENVAPGATRARVLSRLGRIRHFDSDMDTSVPLLVAALAEADDPTRGEIEEGLAWGLLLSRRDLAAAATHARSAVELAESLNDASALAEALAVQALVDFILGRPWHDAMSRALALEEDTLHLRVLRQPSFAHGYILSCADDVDGAREVFDRLLARAGDAGDESSVPSLLNHLTLIECLAGRWDLAAAHADDCYARALESGQRPTQISILGKAALLAARRGDVDSARAKATDALGADFDPADPATVMARGGEMATWALASLELQLGRPEETDRLLGPMVDALIAAGVRDPGEVRFLPDQIEALAVLGEHARAAGLLDHLRAWADRVQRPSAVAAAGRCAGLLASASGDTSAALAELERAALAASQAALPFERGRTLLALGAEQRRGRQRRAARETLKTALAMFEELGAARTADATRDELSRIGGRAASGDELTPSELRIATLVAEGKTNKEVAAALVVSERTVESALTQVYRKLEVRSRTELARKLGDAG